MEKAERLAKVEAEVDAIQDSLNEIKAEQIRVWEAIGKLRDGMEQKFAEQRAVITEQREHTDRGFAEQRGHTDRQFAEQRDHTDRGFAEIRASLNEIRKEQAKTTRWLVSLTIGYGTAILGMMAKMAGMF